MGGNQSKVVNESVTEIVKKFLNSSTTKYVDKVDTSDTISQEITNKITNLALNHCHKFSISNLVTTRYKTIINTKVDISQKQSSDLMEEISKKLNSDISQEMKGLPTGTNDDTVQNVINNLSGTDVKDIVNSSFESSLKKVSKITQKMTNEIGIFDCKYSNEVTIHQNISKDDAILKASQLISSNLQENTDISKISETIDNKIEQKNIGFDLTMVAIVAIIAFLIYIMAESGTLGQLMPGGGGGKSSSGGGVSSVVRNPVTSRSALLAQVEKRMNSVFGAVGKQKAWWVGL
jgi:hypothetical protein